MGSFFSREKLRFVSVPVSALAVVASTVAQAAGGGSAGPQAVGGPHFIQEFSKCQKAKQYGKPQTHQKISGDVEEIPMFSATGRDGKPTYKAGDKKDAVRFCRFDDVVCDVTNVVINPVTDANGKPVKGNKDQVVKGAHISGINCPAESCKDIEVCANYQHGLPAGVHQHEGDKPGPKSQNGWIEKDNPPTDDGKVMK